MAGRGKPKAKSVQIFISYAREDRQKAAALADALKTKGWSVWWDSHIRLGQGYDQEIERALEAASCVIVLWSLASVPSRWVRAQAQVGLERDILVPVLLDDTPPPLIFRSLHGVNVSGWSGEGVHPEIVEMIQHIATTLGTPDRGSAQYGGDDEDLSSAEQPRDDVRDDADDEIIARWLMREFEKRTGVDVSRDQMVCERFLRAARKANADLVSSPQTWIHLPFVTTTAQGPLHMDLTLSREQVSTLREADSSTDDDEIVVRWLMREFKKQTGVDVSRDQIARERLLGAARRANTELASLPYTQVNLPFLTLVDQGPVHMQITLSKEQLLALQEADSSTVKGY